jgi:hypothetical protein
MPRLAPLPAGSVPELNDIFMNRYNDTMATPLEEEPIHEAEAHIAKHGWRAGKHQPVKA